MFGRLLVGSKTLVHSSELTDGRRSWLAKKRGGLAAPDEQVHSYGYALAVILCMVEREIMPCISVSAIIFAYSTPLAFAEVGSPLYQGYVFGSVYCEALVFCCHSIVLVTRISTRMNANTRE